MTSRIAVDAHMLSGRESGNETYIAGLLQGLSEAGHSVRAFTTPGVPLLDMPPGHTYLSLASSSDWRRLAYGLSHACTREHVDLLHLTYNAPLSPPCPFVLTIHDVSYRLYPQYFSLRDRLLLNTLLPWSARRARAVFTGSEATAHDLVRFYPFVRGKVHVIPYAASPLFRTASAAEQARVQSQYALRPPYVLAVGRLDPRKNLARVIEAWRAVRRECDVRLVLTGEMGFQGESLLESVRDERERGEMVVTGYVPPQDLAALYTGAAVFAYPSVYEGFGLPVLEAMACGAPVVTSNVSSLPEVAGQAARLVDPTRTEALASALLEILTTPTFAATLRERGLARASQFSWRATAERTWEIYIQIAK